MKLKFKIKLIVDVFMTALLPLLMAYSLIGEALHEWLGAGMLVLAALHSSLNANWYRNLFRGKYTFSRIFQTVINLASILCMVGLAVSGIRMSRYLFAFVPLRGGSAFARVLHLFCSYWGFILLSLHAGMHIGMAAAVARKTFGVIKPSKIQAVLMRIALIGVCGYGLYAFIKRDIASYLFLRRHFAFFDYSEPMAFFFMDYIVIIVALSFAGHHLSGLLRKDFARVDAGTDTLHQF